MSDDALSYDLLLYPDHPIAHSHPDRLALMASLAGLEPAPLERARVLEIACGGGGNLIPLAVDWPDARFLGIDLARQPIISGCETIAALGLGNIELRQMDLMDLPLDVGRFDYIIAHGFYSWVPKPVRDRFMAVCRDHLAPQGVAYVSFNAYPGCYPSRMLREMMFFHIDRTRPPDEQVREARAFVTFLAQNLTSEDAFAAFVREEAKRIDRMLPGHFFHDDLSQVNDPVWLHELVAHAEAHGLRHLGDADRFAPAHMNRLPPKARSMLRELNEYPTAVEQYVDFLDCARFRMALLCRADAPPARPVARALLERLHVASEARPETPVDSWAGDAHVRFTSPSGARLALTHPVTKAALGIAGSQWPRILPVPELARQVDAALGPTPGVDTTSLVAQTLLLALGLDLASVHLYPPRYALAAGERPSTTALVRRQAGQGDVVANLRHGLARVDDAFDRRLLGLLDGTRDRRALAQAMRPHAGADPNEAALGARIETALANLAEVFLLRA